MPHLKCKLPTMLSATAAASKDQSQISYRSSAATNEEASEDNTITFNPRKVRRHFTEAVVKQMSDEYDISRFASTEANS